VDYFLGFGHGFSFEGQGVDDFLVSWVLVKGATSHNNQPPKEAPGILASQVSFETAGLFLWVVLVGLVSWVLVGGGHTQPPHNNQPPEEASGILVSQVSIVGTCLRLLLACSCGDK
jgi:hypothetical protein